MRNVLCRFALLCVLMVSGQTCWAQITDPGPGGGGQPLKAPTQNPSPTDFLSWHTVTTSPLGWAFRVTAYSSRFMSPRSAAPAAQVVRASRTRVALAPPAQR